MLAGSAAFTAGGVWMITDGNAGGWLVAGFFGLCALVGFVMLLPNAASLELTPQGFTQKTLFRRAAYRWSEVAEFGTHVAGNVTQVGFNFAPEYEQAEAMRALNRGLGFYEGALGDTFGLGADELAALMEEWRTRYGARPPREESAELEPRPVEEVLAEPPGSG